MKHNIQLAKDEDKEDRTTVFVKKIKSIQFLKIDNFTTMNNLLYLG